MERSGTGIGAGKDLVSARQPLFMKRNGLNIAIIAVAENEFGMAQEDKPGGNPLQPVRNIAQICKASAISKSFRNNSRKNKVSVLMFF